LDSLDLALIRGLHRDALDPAKGIDPLVSAGQLAEKQGLSRSTVRARMDSWRQTGFLARIITIPNPGLLGARLIGLMVSFDDPDAKDALLQSLELGIDVFSVTEIGSFLWIVFVERYSGALSRWETYLSRLVSIHPASQFVPISLPPYQGDPSRLDWRLIATIRSDEFLGIGEIAETIRINPRTVSRHYRNLIDSNLILVYPVWDFSRTAGAVPFFTIWLSADADARKVAETIASLFPEQFPGSPATPSVLDPAEALGFDRGFRSRVAPGDVSQRRASIPSPATRLDGKKESAHIGFQLFLESAAKIDEVTAVLRRIPGVSNVTTGFPSLCRNFPQGFDSLMSSVPPLLNGVHRSRGRGSESLLGVRESLESKTLEQVTPPRKPGGGHLRARAERSGRKIPS
jgi:DNA-binding Lrp family transcriptional regulator